MVVQEAQALVVNKTLPMVVKEAFSMFVVQEALAALYMVVQGALTMVFWKIQL